MHSQVPAILGLLQVIAPMAEATIKDIARESGYSIKTVSRVINRYPSVAKEIREKVEAVIEKRDYQPNLWARALRSSRSHIIALFANETTTPYVSSIQLATISACRYAGYHMMSEFVPPNARNMTRVVNNIVETVRLDGAVLVPLESDNMALIKALSGAKVPLVRISPSGNPELSSTVGIDDFKVAYDMVRYLVELGHRDIAFVGGPKLHASAGKRLEGFEAGMKDCGLPIRAEWIVPGDFNVQSGMIAGQRLLSSRTLPTAILASNDDTAVGVMAAAYSKGFAIPRDVSIVGIDDAPIASSFWPKLTTVRQPTADIGRLATEILISEIETAAPRRCETLNCRIVVRESAGPPRRTAKKRTKEIPVPT
jgi:LacI family transcriptional regulator